MVNDQWLMVNDQWLIINDQWANGKQEMVSDSTITTNH